MSFYMSTTQISSDKTAMEISVLLSKFGAKQILTSYENGEVNGLSFCIEKQGIKIPFKLPIKWEPVLKAMKNDRKTARHLCNQSQANRTSWRLILRWVEAQLALVEVGSVKIEEIFLPYAEMKCGRTVYEIYSESQFKMLEGPK